MRQQKKQEHGTMELDLAAKIQQDNDTQLKSLEFITEKNVHRFIC